MMPEHRLDEALKQCDIILNDEDTPDDIYTDILKARNKLDGAKEDIESWRDFVDDAEVVDE